MLGFTAGSCEYVCCSRGAFFCFRTHKQKSLSKLTRIQNILCRGFRHHLVNVILFLFPVFLFEVTSFLAGKNMTPPVWWLRR